MPIPVKKIKRALVPLDQKVLEYLRRNPELAYTDAELVNALRLVPQLPQTPPVDWQTFVAGLAANVLVAALTAEQRAHAEHEVFAALERLVYAGEIRWVDYNGIARYWAAEQRALPTSRSLALPPPRSPE